MMYRQLRLAGITLTLALLGSFTLLEEASARGGSQHVVLNGERVAVNWSDGDSFRVLRGTRKGQSARLMGYNTLESYGPVHFWGGFHGYQLYDVAKKGTEFARSQEWDCQTQGDQDHYGRILVNCPELTKAMVREGFAHVFSVYAPGERDLNLEVLRAQIDTGRSLVAKGKEAAGLGKLEEASATTEKLQNRQQVEEQLRLQLEAQNHRRGIWRWGIPSHIVTSTHSTDEDGKRDKAYNRVCDTRTGNSWKVEHQLALSPCDAWCYGGSCMIYVPFQQRYGKKRPECLRRGKANRLQVPPHLGNPALER
ncbi:MAG: hypothetical protein VYE15_05925 [Myxococcota bacterium]|nr:hypothetical protein [Myxococcota bacterium]